MAKPTIFILVILGLLATLTIKVNGQLGPAIYSFVKPGSCPPARDTSSCIQQCRSDMECSRQYKCCPTSCGAACTIPVTEALRKVVKPGQCPASPDGPWVCTSRCSQDGDCRREYKCCRNRCGALACTAPALY